MKEMNIIFKRFLTVSIALTVMTCMSMFTVYAAETEKAETKATLSEEEQTQVNLNETVVFDAEGNVWHEDVSDYSTATTYSTTDVDGLVISQGSDGEAADEVPSAFSNTPVSQVIINAITFQPYRNVCQVEATFQDEYIYSSSGVLVAPNLVLASGHGIYQPEHQGYPTKITVWPGVYTDSNFHYPWGYANYVKARISSAYVNDTSQAGHDWSIIQLDKKFDSCESFGYAPNHGDLLNRTVRAVGYTSYDEGNTFNMYTATGKINYTSENLIHTAIKTEGGMSGGPIIDVETGAVIGMVQGHDYNFIGAYLYNKSVRIDETLFNILNTDKANGGIQ